MENKQIEEFKTMLTKTNRDGMDLLIEYLEENGFFDAPCSGGYHLAKQGGLLEHSLNVLHEAERIACSLIGSKNFTKEFKDSIVIAALLHDIGKIGMFGKPLYVENVLKSGKKSDAKPYATNSELLYVDHEIRSVTIAQMFIDLTEDEYYAILYHNGLYTSVGRYNLQGKERKLQMIIHFADLWAARVTEV